MGDRHIFRIIVCGNEHLIPCHFDEEQGETLCKQAVPIV